MSGEETTQEFVPIKEIRDGIVTLKNGSICSIILVSSTNFALKSEGEQEAIISQFQNFLNSITFSIQIVIQSRRLDIRPYLNTLSEREKVMTNDLLKIQVREYMQFIKQIAESNNIINKSFFVVIPYTPAQIENIKFPMFKKGVQRDPVMKPENFEEHKVQLEQRISMVQSGITRCGLRSVVLGTDEEVELFYKLLNPSDVETSVKK
jgi:type IV secretory pathway VirB4 component